MSARTRERRAAAPVRRGRRVREAAELADHDHPSVTTPSSVSRRVLRAVRSGWSRSRGRGTLDPLAERDPAAGQHQHPVGQRERLVHVVRDQQHRGLVMRPQPEHQAVHGDRGQRVQRAERLVQQEQAGLADQRPGQGRPLGLAAGQGQRPGARPGRPGRPRPARRGPPPSGSPARSPRHTLAQTRRQGSSRGSWNATAAVPVTPSSPVTPGPARPARAAGWTSRCRCGRSAPRTHPARCPGPARRARAGPRTPGSARGPRRRAAGRGGRRRWPPVLSDPAVRGAMPAPSFPAAGPGRR